MFTPILLTFAGGDDDHAIRRVAEEIATTLREEGLETDVHELHGIPSLAPYRAVVLGAPFSESAWPVAARQFMSHHRDGLIALPVAVFALAPASPDPKENRGRRVLLEEMTQYRWLHPIAAEVFRVAARPEPVIAGVGSATATTTAGGPATVPAPGMVDREVVRSWARLVARLLIPTPMR